MSVTENEDICPIEGCNYPIHFGDFCDHHVDSDTKLHEAFEKWKIAYDGEITWEDYLKFILDDSTAQAGRYIRELAEYYLLQKTA